LGIHDLCGRKNGRQFFLNLPLTLLGEFGEGVFDAVLIEALDRNAQAGTGQVLAKLSDTAQPGIFTSILASVLSAQLGRAAVGKKKKPPGPCTAVLEGPDCVCIGEMQLISCGPRAQAPAPAGLSITPTLP
jgi:hypothetical protein